MIAVVAFVLALSGSRVVSATAAAPAVDTRSPRIENVPASGPIVRIGLTTDRRKVTLSADGPYRILDGAAAAGLPAQSPSWKKEYREEVLVTTHGAAPTDARVWRVQIAAVATREEAEALAKKLAAGSGEEVSVAYNPDRGSWRVRAGAAPAREGIEPVLARMRANGYPEAWVFDEPAQGGQAWIRLVDSDYQSAALAVTRVIVEPGRIESGSAEPGREVTLSVDGRRYRGSLEVLVDASSGLRVVNVLPIEDYLRGVVPAELGPIMWPEIEAQKAQAIAARTYIVKNLGRFSAEGFDICDTPRCQVYEGAASEHPLSDRAVRETAGLIATFDGAPINALYTSTCGGHTEDGGEIFPEEVSPYLIGVDCYPEDEVLARQGSILEGSAAADAGGPADRILASATLIAAGVLPADALRLEWSAQPLGEAEARDLIEAFAGRLGLEGAIGDGRRAGTRLGFSLALSDRMGGRERAEFLVDARDLPVLLAVAPDLIPVADRRMAASLQVRGLLPDLGTGTLKPDALLQRGEAALLLARAAALYEVPETGEGSYMAASRSPKEGGMGLRLRGSGNAGVELKLAAPGRLALFLDSGKGPVPATRLAVYPGDRLRYTLGDEGDTRVLTVLPRRKGLSDDRMSPSYAWETAFGAADLDAKLSERFGTGPVRDIVTLRRGVSGRITSARIVGAKSEATVSGWNLRGALGLKDSPLVVERQRAADGTLRRAVFAGKGWGHGVGMCQVGAFGMAARGKHAEEILKHYYTGIALKKIW